MKHDFLTEKEAAEVLNVAPKTLSRWRWLGKGPKYHKFGGAVRYMSRELEHYVEQNAVQTLA